jgi:transposase-like protein
MARKPEDMPETLLGAVVYFADEDVAHTFFANFRFPSGEQHCPHCGSVAEHYFLSARRVWKCRDCRKQFSIKVGTILEDSPIKLSKWLPAMWMLANSKNGISSMELARALGVTQKTAWFMLQRIRLAMQNGSFDKFDGDVEVDETFIGGRARFMHKDRKERVIQGSTGVVGKVAVMGLLERHGEDKKSRVRTAVVRNTRKATLQTIVRKNVEAGSSVYSDALKSYDGLDAEYVHKVVDHAECYAKGKVHTNGLENFWSLVKRAVKGTYVSVEPFHLFRYLDEQAFRFNERHDNDAGRFLSVLRTVVGKRLTYSALTGEAMCQT